MGSEHSRRQTRARRASAKRTEGARASASDSKAPPALTLATSAELRECVAVQAASLQDAMVSWRRDFHRHAETGWLEFRTASIIGRKLEDGGWHVVAGRDVVSETDRMGVPAPPVLASALGRAREQGGDAAYLDKVRGGFTGLVALRTMGGGDGGQGPVVALRFDIDALDLQESDSPQHRPAALGFASVNEGAMHACGHDAHAAIGLGVASALSALSDTVPELLPRGTIKLVFQPAEEGVRGAKAMVAAGVLDDVAAVAALHVYSGWPVGQVACGRDSFLATDKFDVIFTGEPAHAGGNPQGGKNALLAAATAALNLHALPRHREGPTRINVGRLVAGQGRNVIPASAYLAIETRGGTSQINDSLRLSAERVIRSAAAMYGCSVEIRSMGAAQSAKSNPEFYERAAAVVSALPGLEVRDPEPGGGSEDFTYMMRRVQERGGWATAMGIGADLGGFGHHTAEFDIDEAVLSRAVTFLTVLALDLLANPLAAPEKP